MSVKHTTVIIFTPLLVFCIGLHCCFSLLLLHDRLTLPCLRVFLCRIVPNLGGYLARRISQSRCRHLERALMIDHRKKHETLSYLSVLTVTGSQMCTTSAVCGSRGVEPGSLLGRTNLLIQVKRNDFSVAALSRANSSGNACLAPTCDSACNLANSGASCGVSDAFGRLRQTFAPNGAHPMSKHRVRRPQRTT